MSSQQSNNHIPFVKNIDQAAKEKELATGGHIPEDEQIPGREETQGTERPIFN